MIRTQVSLREDEMTRLRELAAERDVSIASLLREAVDRLLEDVAMAERRARAIAAAGKFSWEGSARDHDADFVESIEA